MDLRHRLQITCPGPSSMGTKVLLNGQEIEGIRELKLSCTAGDVWRVELEFIPGGLEVDVLTAAISAGAAYEPADEIYETTLVGSGERTYQLGKRS